MALFLKSESLREKMGEDKMNKKRKRFLIISTTKEATGISNEISMIRGDAVKCTMKEKTSFFDSINDLEKIMSKKKCPLFMSTQINKSKEMILTVGRTFNKEIIDMMEFKVDEYKNTEYFVKECGRVGPEIGVKYFIIFQGLNDPRVENLFLDILNMKSKEICLENVMYAFILSKIGGNAYSLKYARILTNGDLEEVGPSISMECTRMFFCSNELFKKACSVQKPGKTKNVSKNDFNDTIGTVHIGKQDLRDIRLKKGKGFKNNKGPSDEK
jgi:ribosome production factor 2